ncbi:MAG: efflux RND transporter periplasmic adaptor subunit [Puniceicoccaceae bacterium]
MPKKKKSKLKIWILLIVVIAVGGGLTAVSLKGGKKGTEVSLKEVKRGDITALVTATGKIQPETTVVISSEVPGEIIELPVKDGQKVNKGDLLVRVNPDTLDAQVKQQEAALAATRAASAQSRAEMLKAELDQSRTQDLFDKGFVTQDELDRVQTRLEVTKASHEASLHQIDRQEMQLKEASDKLAKASLYSPITGTIVQLRSELGDRVVGTGQFAGTEIMRVADLNAMEVRVDVSEADIIDVKIGDFTKIEIDALPKAEYTGKVTEIANSARTTNERSSEQLTTFEVKVTLIDPGEELRPGMTATADIETKTVEDVIKVPIGSVVVRPKRELEKEEDSAEDSEEETSEDEEEDSKDKEDNRVRVVFVAKDGKAELRKVETGIADSDDMEITSGLEVGEKVITGPYRALTRDLKDESEIREKDDNKDDKKKA